MLTTHVERYLSLRQTLGFKLRNASRNVRAFARFAAEMGDHHVRVSTVVHWAAAAPSPHSRYIRFRDVVGFAHFVHAEDSAHEVPRLSPFRRSKVRSVPYIYRSEEVARIVHAAGSLHQTYPLRRQVYATLFGLIAATGLRISEALDLRLDDVLSGGILQIRKTKFGKSRLVPLHPTAEEALGRYLRARRQVATTNDYVFLSAGNRRISSCTVSFTFRRVRQLAGITPDRARPPRIHDMRHTFATRALEQCSPRRDVVARHFVALATYLGHSNIASTYWYLEATTVLMTDIAAAAEALVEGGRR